MEMATIIPFIFIGMMVGLFGVMAGYKARYASHQFRIKKDIRFVLLLFGQFIIIMVLLMNNANEDSFLSVLAIMAIFTMMYIVGFRMARPDDIIYLDAYDEDLDRSVVGPIAYYDNKYGEQCIMIPKLKWSFKGLLGVTCPLEMDISTIMRSRDTELWSGKKYKKYHVHACWHQKEDIEPTGKIRIGSRKLIDEDGTIEKIPRYLIHMNRESHNVFFADSVTSDPRMYEQRTELYKDAVKIAEEERQYSSRLEIQMTSLTYDAAATLVKGLIDVNLDAPGVRDRILTMVEEERARRKSTGIREGS